MSGRRGRVAADGGDFGVDTPLSPRSTSVRRSRDCFTHALRICLIHLADYEAAYSGSFVPMVREALLRAQGQGWRAIAVFPEEARGRAWGRALADELEVAYLPPSRAAVARLVAEEETVILHTHFTRYDLPAALVASRRLNAHVVWHAHSFLRSTPPARLRGLVKYMLGRRLVDAIVCVAPHLVRELVRRGASRRQTLYLPNGIDTARFSPAPPHARAAARAALGLAIEKPVVLHYGWSWHLKGGDLFCAAIAELRRRGLEVTAVTVGAGVEADADARRFGVQDDLMILPHAEDVEQLLAAADVFALPSRGEGMPFAVLEALASGVPVVAGNIPGDTLADELAAYRAVALEPPALADAIEIQLRTTDDQRVAARAHVEAERSLAAWGERMQSLYEAILAPRTLVASPR